MGAAPCRGGGNPMNNVILGDSLFELQNIESESIDFVCTDPPYGYSFMGKDWDKAVPSVEIWQECLRVLKPGAFCCVMSAPRSDVQCAMISRLQEAGFRLDFTPIYWTYASGFPKAGNIRKLIDKRLVATRDATDDQRLPASSLGANAMDGGVANPDYQYTKATSAQAKALDGSYAGFQPKPAVEVIIVAMKPLSEKTYVDQALSNGHGVSWLDDGRIPTDSSVDDPRLGGNGSWKTDKAGIATPHAGERISSSAQGRFPANLLVSDDVLNDGVERRSIGGVGTHTGNKMGYHSSKTNFETMNYSDSGSYSRYFDLDKWAQTLPFLITPKASKSEKNKGLEHFQALSSGVGDERPSGQSMQRLDGREPRTTQSYHPTVKPLKLMSYLIALFSRPNDVVLDPFAGSGTTCIAAKNLRRDYIGIEREVDYVTIAEARLSSATESNQERLFDAVLSS